MKVILDTLSNAFNENLEVVALLLISDLITSVLNIILGTIIGSNKDAFDLKKFLYGFLKLFASQCIIFAFCYALNLISLALDLIEERFDLKILTDNGQSAIIAVIDIISIIWVRIKDTCLDVMEKIKSMRTLKYVSYDDVKLDQINDYEVGGLG